MRVFLCLVTLCLVLTAAPRILADAAPDTTDLPIGLTQWELEHLDLIGIAHQTTTAPTGVQRNPAEWERSQGVIIRWPLGIPISLVAEMSEDVVVTTIVGSTSEQNSAISAYTSGGVNMAHTDWLIAPTNSIWTRDYGPWFIYTDRRLAIVDHIYNRPRPLDDVIPQAIGAAWGLHVYGMDLITTGGNHMSDGLGRSMSTRLVYDENPTKTSAEVDSIMFAYLGNDYTVLNYIESGGIHHIDCWAKFLSPTTIIVKDVAPSDPSYSLLNARADYLAQQISAWGQPYTIVRVFCPSGTAYTNSLILNNKVLVPIFGSAWDDDALQTYRDAMPGYEVLGFTGSWLDDDAIHCRAMGVPDQFMLFVNHTPTIGAIPPDSALAVTATISDYSRAGLIADSLKVYYRVDSGAWDYALLSPAGGYEYSGAIPAQPAGSVVDYYIKAADNSGRIETHPFIGEPGAHRYRINAPPQINQPDSFVCRAGDVFTYHPDYSDPDDTDLTVSFADLPAWLAADADSVSGTVPAERRESAFTVEVSDPYTTATRSINLSLYICGDVNDDGDGPNIADLTALVAYLFSGGPPPSIERAANVDGLSSGGIDINIADLTYFVAYLFTGGPAPVCTPAR